MSWGDAIRQPRIHGERRRDQEAKPGDICVLDALAAAGDIWTPMAALGGHACSQAVYRLRNTHGADIIETRTGLGYRLTKRGRAVAANPCCSEESSADSKASGEVFKASPAHSIRRPVEEIA